MDTVTSAYVRIMESSQHPMIMLNAIPRHATNSLGHELHPTYDGQRNFHKWFSSSKMVDSIGRPQVFFHGTGSDIKSFSHEFVGKGTDYLGSGFYFSDSSETANAYAASKGQGQNVVPVYLRLRNPIHADSHQPLRPAHIRSLITAAPYSKRDLQNFGEVNDSSYASTLKSAVDAYSSQSKKQALFNISNDFYRNTEHNFLKNVQPITKHDGIIDKSGDSTIINVFNPNNIKSAIGNDGSFDHKTNITETYRSEHASPDSTYAPAHNLTHNGIYPGDVYASYGLQHYGDTSSASDKESWEILRSVKNKPNALVKIYRAVPLEEAPSALIKRYEDHKRHILRRGNLPPEIQWEGSSSSYYDHVSDEIERLSTLTSSKSIAQPKIESKNWVSLSRSYAVAHGKAHLKNSYKILSKTVPASHIHTDGNSLSEFGYNPPSKTLSDPILEAYQQVRLSTE